MQIKDANVEQSLWKFTDHQLHCYLVQSYCKSTFHKINVCLVCCDITLHYLTLGNSFAIIPDDAVASQDVLGDTLLEGDTLIGRRQMLSINLCYIWWVC